MSMARATKAESELRVGEAASMLAQGNGATVVMAHVAETYRLSGRQARRITARSSFSGFISMIRSFCSFCRRYELYLPKDLK